MPKHDEVELLLESLLRVEGLEKREALRARFMAAIEVGMTTEPIYNKWQRTDLLVRPRVKNISLQKKQCT